MFNTNLYYLQFKKAGSEIPVPFISDVSRSYRGIILDLIQSLRESNDEGTGRLYSDLDLVWQFCEVMFISSHPGVSNNET